MSPDSRTSQNEIYPDLNKYIQLTFQRLSQDVCPVSALTALGGQPATLASVLLGKSGSEFKKTTM